MEKNQLFSFICSIPLIEQTRNRMSEKKLTAQQEIWLKEYDFAEKLRESYFKNSWVASSILIPISWGLVGLSYTEPVLALDNDLPQLFPLVIASLVIFGFWFWYDERYAGYMKVIYHRFWELEEKLSMNLHRKIRDKGPSSWWKIRWLKIVVFALLFFAWLNRLGLVELLSQLGVGM